MTQVREAGFAGFVLVIVGALDGLQRLVAIIKDEYVVGTAKGLAIVDVTAWGWSTLLRGLLVLAGFGLLGGAGWARWLSIIGVSINAIGQIAFMANYPQAYPPTIHPVHESSVAIAVS